MDKQNFSVKLNGVIYGDLWWSGEAWKDVNATAKDDDTLRDLVLRVTNDGDFQGCDLTADSSITVTLIKPNRRITRTFDINLFPSVADCIGEKESYDFPVMD